MKIPLTIHSLLLPLLALAVAAILATGATSMAFAGNVEDKEEEDVGLIKSKGHGWLGVTMQDVDEDMAKALDLENDGGVLVDSVFEDSPAEDAGLEDGDVILEFAGKEIANTRDLAKAVQKTKPGEEVEIVVLRDGKQQTLTAEIGKRKSQSAGIHIWTDDEGGNAWVYRMPENLDGHYALRGHFDEDRGYLGINPQDLSEQLGEYFGVEEGKGVLVAEVIEDGPAAEAGLQAGDVIVKIDTEVITETSDIHEYLGELKKGEEVQVTILRDKRERTIPVIIDELPDEFAWNGEDSDVFIPHWNSMKQLRGMHKIMPHVERFRFHSEDEMDMLKEEMEELREELKKLKEELHEG